MPDWNALASNVLSGAFSESVTEQEFKQLSEALGWPPEIWIQAALNALGGETEQLNKLMEAALYGPLLADAKDIAEPLTQLLNMYTAVSGAELEEVAAFFERHSETSVVKLAKLFASLPDDCLPLAVINTNADTLFESLVRLYQIRDWNRQQAKSGLVASYPESRFKRIISESSAPDHKIPIFHIHGCLLPLATRGKANRTRDMRSKLVFPEASYTSIAGAGYSWAETTFIYYAQFYKLVFVGTSIADPNIRRWLAWTMDSRHRSDVEMKKRDGRSATHSVETFKHWWVKTRHTNTTRNAFIEAGVKHLGIKNCYIDSWPQADDAFANLLAFTR